jgi:hypothetical protein
VKTLGIEGTPTPLPSPTGSSSEPTELIRTKLSGWIHAVTIVKR